MATPRLTFVTQTIRAPSLARARAQSVWYESEVDRPGVLKVLQIGEFVLLIRGMPMPKTRHGGLTGSLGDQSCEPHRPLCRIQCGGASPGPLLKSPVRAISWPEYPAAG